MIARSPTTPVRSRWRSSPSPVNSGRRAVGYVRVSTVDQGRSGLGLEAQKASIRETCVAEGWNLTSMYSDVESGGKDLREGLQKALESLQTGNLLVVREQSRLGRRFASLAMIEALEDRGVRVYIAESRRFAGTDLHTGFEGILSVEERRKIRERTRAALAAKKARGEHLGPVPFGYRRATRGGRLEQDPEAFARRRRALRLRRDGKALRAIATLVGVSPATLCRLFRTACRAGKLRAAA